MQPETKTLTAFDLKIIAIIAMTINHIAHGFQLRESNPGFYLFAMIIGKLTFPIMAYLLVQGYRHTRSVKKYAARLALFWVLSIVPFWLVFSYPRPFQPTDLCNNVMFTLLLGLLLLVVTDRMENDLIRVAMLVLFALATAFSDWNVVGIFMIYGFHHIHNEKYQKTVPLLYTFAVGIISLLVVMLMMDEPVISMLVQEGVAFAGILLVIPLLFMYHGARGQNKPWMKWGFYLYYPLHMLIIGVLANFIL